MSDGKLGCLRGVGVSEGRLEVSEERLKCLGEVGVSERKRGVSWSEAESQEPRLQGLAWGRGSEA